MKTSISFYAKASHSISINNKKLHNLTTEQIDRLERDYASLQEDVRFEIPSALTVLLDINPNQTINVPAESLNDYCDIFDTGDILPVIKVDKGAILRAWLDSGAPTEWNGTIPNEETKKASMIKHARDAAGRFCRITEE